MRGRVPARPGRRAPHGSRLPPLLQPLHHDRSAPCGYRLVTAAALEVAAWRAPSLVQKALRRLVLPSLRPGLGRGWERGRPRTTQFGARGEGTLGATVRPPDRFKVLLGRPWEALGRWMGPAQQGIQQVLEVGEAGGRGWG